MLRIELIQVALGLREELSRVPTEQEWDALLNFANEQTLLGVLFSGIERLPKVQQPYLDMLLEWYGVTEQIKHENGIVDGAIRRLCEDSFRDCKRVLLKGHAVARYYPKPELRISGDIDLWCVKRGMTMGESLPLMAREALALNPSAGLQPHHTDWPGVEGVMVELHFTPSTVYSFFYNRRIQRFFQEALSERYGEFEVLEDLGEVRRLPVDVDILFQLMHMRRHLIAEGIGLRQVIDLFYTCRAAQKKGCRISEKILRYLGLQDFAGAMAHVLNVIAGEEVTSKVLTTRVDKRRGGYVLKEMLRGGNFGAYKSGKGNIGVTRWQHLIYYTRLSLRNLRYFPRESLCSPLYRVYVGAWRRVMRLL